MRVSSLGALLLPALLAMPAPSFADPKSDYESGLDILYKKGSISGAMPLIKKAADEGHPKAQALFGYLMDWAEDNQTALKYYEMAIAQNEPDGHYGIAVMYMSGDAGAVDMGKARKYLELAAAGNHLDAINVLAHSYIKGGLGLTDEERQSGDGVRWMTAAAAANDILSLQTLESAYRIGQLGLAADPVKAGEYRKQLDKLLPRKEETNKRQRKKTAP